MRICSISWNPETDVTKVKFSDDFKYAHLMARLDVLQDAIAMLQEEYGKAREEFRDSAKSVKLS